MGTLTENWTSIALMFVDHFSFIPLCLYLTVKCSAFQFFLSKQIFIFISVKNLNSSKYGIKTNTLVMWVTVLFAFPDPYFSYCYT